MTKTKNQHNNLLVAARFLVNNKKTQATPRRESMWFKTVFIIFIFILNTDALRAATITNNIVGVGNFPNLVNPYFCIQNSDGQVTYALAPGSSVDGNRYSGNLYYVGGALRFGGCTSAHAYLGYVGFNVNEQHDNKVSSYGAPTGVHITYSNPDIDNHGNISGKIRYTPIQPNFNLLSFTPHSNTNWSFVGINLSGLEFGKMIDPVVIPNLSLEEASGKYSDLTDTQAFLKAGMNTVRLPLSWGYLQLEGPGQGEIHSDYYDSYVKPLLESLTLAHVYVIVDLHAYMRYSIFGKEYSGCGSEGKCPDGTLVLDANAYQNVWTKLFLLTKNDTKINMDYILLDLVNEPVEVPDDKVFTIQAQVIKSLRQQGYEGYILVEGNAWSGLHSFVTQAWKSQDGKTTYSNATLFTRNHFAKAGIADLSKIIINVHQYLDNNYSGTHDECLANLNTTGTDGFNLNAFVDYLQQNHLKAIVTELGVGRDHKTCVPALTYFLNYLKDNSANNRDYGFIGWTIWSAGHGFGDYPLRVTPRSYQMEVLQNYLQ